MIVFTRWPGQPPQIVEDQITYPIAATMLSVANLKVVRGYSYFGFSFVYVIFKDGTDIYWARSRVLKYLSSLQGQMPSGVTPELGPDATPVGWVLDTPLVDHGGKNDLAKLRTIQDWYLRYKLETVPEVAEVADLGGYVKQFQVNVDPNRLLAYDIQLGKVVHESAQQQRCGRASRQIRRNREYGRGYRVYRNLARSSHYSGGGRSTRHSNSDS